MTKHPDIAALNARLAHQNRRVQTRLDEVIGRLDPLVDAALSGDWEGVRRWSSEITQTRSAEESEVLESAQRLLQAADRAENEAELKRHVMRLIAACGKAQSKAKMP
jgi:hypothetical protein